MYSPKKKESEEEHKARLKKTALGLPTTLIKKAVVNMHRRVRMVMKAGGDLLNEKAIGRTQTEIIFSALIVRASACSTSVRKRQRAPVPEKSHLSPYHYYYQGVGQRLTPHAVDPRESPFESQSPYSPRTVPQTVPVVNYYSPRTLSLSEGD